MGKFKCIWCNGTAIGPQGYKCPRCNGGCTDHEVIFQHKKPVEIKSKTWYSFEIRITMSDGQERLMAVGDMLCEPIEARWLAKSAYGLGGRVYLEVIKEYDNSEYRPTSVKFIFSDKDKLWGKLTDEQRRKYASTHGIEF